MLSFAPSQFWRRLCVTGFAPPPRAASARPRSMPGLERTSYDREHRQTRNCRDLSFVMTVAPLLNFRRAKPVHFLLHIYFFQSNPACAAPARRAARRPDRARRRETRGDRTSAPSCFVAFVAKLADLELADLVAERLAGPDDVAIDLDGDVLRGLGGVDARRSRSPAAASTPIECSPVSTTSRTARHISYVSWPKREYGILVEAHLVAEAFSVQRPPLDERGVARVLAELRQVAELLRERDLEMMAGHGFVQRQRLHFPLRPRLQLVRVRVHVAGTAGGRRAGLVVGGRLRRRDGIGHALDAVRQARQACRRGAPAAGSARLAMSR